MDAHLSQPTHDGSMAPPPYASGVSELDLRRRRRSARGLGAFVVTPPPPPATAPPSPELAGLLDQADEVLARRQQAAPAAIAKTPALIPLSLDVSAVGQVVAQAMAAQGELADRLIAANRRIDDLVVELKAAREEHLDFEATMMGRVRETETARDQLVGDLAERLHRLEGERDRLLDELETLKAHQVDATAERLADALSPRIAGVLDAHTGMADRYAQAAHRIGVLEARVAHLVTQLDRMHVMPPGGPSLFQRVQQLVKGVFQRRPDVAGEGLQVGDRV